MSAVTAGLILGQALAMPPPAAAAAKAHLQHRAGPPCERSVQRREERPQACAWLVPGLVRVAQPLQRTDADGSVKGACAQGQALAHVTQQQVALNLCMCVQLCAVECKQRSSRLRAVERQAQEQPASALGRDCCSPDCTAAGWATGSFCAPRITQRFHDPDMQRCRRRRGCCCRCCRETPHTSRSRATSSMAADMSTPTQEWPSSVRASPLSPLPQPMSSRSRGMPSCGSASSSSARCGQEARQRSSSARRVEARQHMSSMTQRDGTSCTNLSDHAPAESDGAAAAQVSRT